MALLIRDSVPEDVATIATIFGHAVLHGERVQGHIGGDIRIPIAVPANPRGITQQRWQCRPIFSGIILAEHFAEFRVNIDHHVHDHGGGAQCARDRPGQP